MNLAQLENKLLTQLGGDVTAYSAELRAEALAEAVYEYSLWKPDLRRMSAGVLFTDVAGAVMPAQVVVIGGYWSVGDTVNLDAFSSRQEGPFTITGVQNASAPANPMLTTTAQQLTLATAPTLPHYAGGVVQKLPNPAVSSVLAGLTLVAGQDSYVLPPDLVDVELESFDLAVGVKEFPEKQNAFYDSLYGVTNLLSGVGAGGASNYAGFFLSAGFGGSGFAALPGGVPISPDNGTAGSIWRLSAGRPRILTLAPVPDQAQVLDFWYYGSHTAETLPDDAAPAVLAWAKKLCWEARITTLADRGDRRRGDSLDHYSRTIMVLEKRAAAAEKLFEDRVRNIPYATMG